MILCLFFDGQAAQVCDAEGPNNPPAFFFGVPRPSRLSAEIVAPTTEAAAERPEVFRGFWVWGFRFRVFWVGDSWGSQGC